MRALAAVFVFAVSVFGQGVAVNPYPRPLVPAGGAASSVPASGVTGITNNIVPKGTGGGLGNSSITDNGTTVSTTEPISAPSISTGTGPTCTAGTGGASCSSEGTAPSVGPAAGVDVLYADATQHGYLANFNNAGYLPLVQGPASNTSGNLASYSGTNGGKVVDSGKVAANVISTTDTGTVTNTMLAGSITNAKLSNSTIPVNGTTCTLGTACYTPVLQNSQSVAYTTVLADEGKQILHPTADNNARTFTIDSNANVAYPIGTVLTFVNQVNTLTIAIATDTLQLAGTATTGSRTLAVGGYATALKVGTTLWYISGPGLT